MPFSQVEAAIASAITAGNAAKLENVVRVSNASFENQSWDSVFAAIEKRLNPVQVNIVPKEAAALFSLLKTTFELGIKSALDNILRFVDGGHLFHAFFNSHQANDIETKAFLFALVMEHRPSMQTPMVLGQSAQGYAALIAALGTDDEKLAALIVQQLNQSKKIASLFHVVDARKGL